MGQQPVCASVLEKLSEDICQQVSESLSTSASFPQARGTPRLPFVLYHSHINSSLWDLYENKQPGREAAALTSRKKTESDQKHIQAGGGRP